jgi:hypothetical protein
MISYASVAMNYSVLDYSVKTENEKVLGRALKGKQLGEN